MSIQTALSRINTLQSDLNRLNGQLSTAVNDRANKAKRVAQIKQSLSSNTSPSTARSKANEITRLESDIARLMEKEGDITRRIATKQSDLSKAQKQLYDEQAKEQKNEQRKVQDRLAELDRQALQAREQDVRRAVGDSLAPKDGGDAEPVHDAFISHASEDKEDVVRPLAEALQILGFDIWYDEFRLTVGDSLRRSIDRGLSRSRFGIVVLSPAFLEKQWPQYELDGMVSKEMEGRKVILPIWHRVSKNEVMRYSPTLADRLALSTANYTIEELAELLGKALRP